MAIFDYEGARKVASDDDIARHLSAKVGFDYDGAINAGADPSDIVKHFFDTGQVTQDRQPMLEATKQSNLENKGDFERGLLSATDALQASGLGMAALTGEGLKRVGLEQAGQWVKDKGMEGYKRNMEEASLNPTTSFTDIDSVGSAIDWAQGGIGSLIPSMAEAAVGAAAGSVVAPGPGTAAGGLAGRTILKKTIDKLTKEAIESQNQKV